MKERDKAKRATTLASATTTLKVCRVCKVEQTLLNFYVHSMYRDGVLPTCSGCLRAKAQAKAKAEKEAADAFLPPPPRSRLRIVSAVVVTTAPPSVAEGAT